MSFKIFSTEDFRELREASGYYVDKTGFFERLYNGTYRTILFARPRRFGKTLFMSMLAEFFDITKNSKELFAGLNVTANEIVCKKWMNKYPVVSFTFKGLRCPTYERMLVGIGNVISDFCQWHEYLTTSKRVLKKDRKDICKLIDNEADVDTLERSLAILTRAMTCHYEKRAILLIDEYDIPLERAATAKNPYYGDSLDFMRTFLSGGVKTNSKSTKFTILTGVLRIAKQSLFSDVNNVKCFDIETTIYDELFGFTQNEVNKLLAEAGFEEKREIIKEWYDGYSFGDRKGIYNPWSIMEYLATLKLKPLTTPQAFWVYTGRQSLPRDFVSRLPPEADVQGQIAALSAGYGIAATLNTEMNYDVLYTNVDNFWTLLYLTGYLTKSDDPSIYQGMKRKTDTVLVIPNKEIHEVFEKEVESWLKSILPDNKRVRLFDALWEQDAQVCEEVLNDMLAHDGLHEQRESYYHGMVKGAFDMWYPETTSSGQGGKGFYDLLVPDREHSRAAVIEFKRATSEKTMESYAEKALKQIEDRAYDARLRAEGCKTILHVGIAFYDIKAKVLFKDASPGKDRV